MLGPTQHKSYQPVHSCWIQTSAPPGPPQSGCRDDPGVYPRQQGLFQGLAAAGTESTTWFQPCWFQISDPLDLTPLGLGLIPPGLTSLHVNSRFPSTVMSIHPPLPYIQTLAPPGPPQLELALTPWIHPFSAHPTRTHRPWPPQLSPCTRPCSEQRNRRIKQEP